MVMWISDELSFNKLAPVDRQKCNTLFSKDIGAVLLYFQERQWQLQISHFCCYILVFVDVGF